MRVLVVICVVAAFIAPAVADSCKSLTSAKNTLHVAKAADKCKAFKTCEATSCTCVKGTMKSAKCTFGSDHTAVDCSKFNACLKAHMACLNTVIHAAGKDDQDDCYTFAMMPRADAIAIALDSTKRADSNLIKSCEWVGCNLKNESKVAKACTVDNTKSCQFVAPKVDGSGSDSDGSDSKSGSGSGSSGAVAASVATAIAVVAAVLLL